MKNRFNLNEEEKNHIRGLHNINEDAGMDTPGGNPEYFYGDGSLDKLRKFAEEQDSEMPKEEIVKNLLQIQGLLSEGAPAIALRRVTELLGKMGGFKDNINEQPEVDVDGEKKEKVVKLGNIIKDIVKSYRDEGILTDNDTLNELDNMLWDTRNKAGNGFDTARFDTRYLIQQYPKAAMLLPPSEAFKLLCKHTK